VIPASYDAATPTPLVIVLHGYSDTTAYPAAVFRLMASQEAAGFLMISPVGTLDTAGSYFWNATDACCNFDGNPVDDVAYLDGLITEVSAAYNVDPKRVFIVGHSNGAFMAYRFACERAGRVAAIVSVAGATYNTAASCVPSQPVNILQVHGNADMTISYTGGSITIAGAPKTYPSAAGTVQRWATYNGCAGTTTAGAAIDLMGDAATETTSLSYDACPAGGAVALWTVDQAPHLIFFKAGPPLLWNWLAAHARP